MNRLNLNRHGAIQLAECLADRRGKPCRFSACPSQDERNAELPRILTEGQVKRRALILTQCLVLAVGHHANDLVGQTLALKPQ